MGLWFRLAASVSFLPFAPFAMKCEAFHTTIIPYWSIPCWLPSLPPWGAGLPPAGEGGGKGGVPRRSAAVSVPLSITAKPDGKGRLAVRQLKETDTLLDSAAADRGPIPWLAPTGRFLKCENSQKILRVFEAFFLRLFLRLFKAF